MTSVLSDRVCFLRMPAILPMFPTFPQQPVQLCATLETGAKLFSGNFSTALSDAKKQAWTAEISISPHVDRHNGDPQPGQAGHNGITRWKRHQSTSPWGAPSMSTDLTSSLRKAKALLKNTLQKFGASFLRAASGTHSHWGKHIVFYLWSAFVYSFFQWQGFPSLVTLWGTTTICMMTSTSGDEGQHLQQWQKQVLPPCSEMTCMALNAPFMALWAAPWQAPSFSPGSRECPGTAAHTGWETRNDRRFGPGCPL